MNSLSNIFTPCVQEIQPKFSENLVPEGVLSDRSVQAAAPTGLALFDAGYACRSIEESLSCPSYHTPQEKDERAQIVKSEFRTNAYVS